MNKNANGVTFDLQTKTLRNVLKYVKINVQIK
jgi:hypothetical protein